jgi:methyl-accepting chemotaxis protein
MSFLRQLNIGFRLAIGYGVLLVLMVVMAGLGVARLNTIDQESRSILDVSLQKERALDDWYRNSFAAVRRTTAQALVFDPKLEQVFGDEIKVAVIHNNELADRIGKLLTSPQERDLLQAVQQRRKAFNVAKDAAALARKDGRADEAAKLFEAGFQPAARNYLESIERLVEYEKSDIDHRAQALAAAGSEARVELMMVCAVGLALGLTLAWVLTQSITSPLRRVVKDLERVSVGDLSGDVEVVGADEFSTLAQTQAAMVCNLRRLIDRVKQVADQISLGAKEIAGGALDLSQRTETQASSLQETAASMEELTSAVQHTADNSLQAHQLANSANDVANRGNEVVCSVVGTMDDITSSSKRIAHIIGVIDSIAFQTNILALNAAVEAARAGEQGRGFAVVASEVRTLAKRSAEAARDIKSLIGDSIARIERGALLVGAAGSTMGDIVGQVQRVTHLVSEINSATSEQASGITQIGAAVNMLDTMTQQNAALVEESAAAAASLEHQAHHLTEAVAAFRL